MVKADASPMSSAKLQLRSGSHIPATGAKPTADQFAAQYYAMFRHNLIEDVEDIDQFSSVQFSLFDPIQTVAW